MCNKCSSAETFTVYKNVSGYLGCMACSPQLIREAFLQEKTTVICLKVGELGLLNQSHMVVGAVGFLLERQDSCGFSNEL